MSDIYASAKSTVNIADNTDHHLNTYLSAKSKVTLTDDTDVYIHTSKSINGVINDDIQDIDSKETIGFINKPIVKTQGNFISAPLWDNIPVDLGDTKTSILENLKVLFNNITYSFKALHESLITEFIRSFEDNFYITIGVILGDVNIKFHFTNLTTKIKEIKQIRIPGEAGIELASDYSGVTLLPKKTLEIEGKVIYNKGSKVVKDFLVVELKSGELLKFRFDIVREADNVFILTPDVDGYTEEWTLDAIQYESLNGRITMEQKSSVPKITEGRVKFTAIGKSQYNRMLSIVEYGRERRIYQPLWIWLFPLNTSGGSISEILLPSDNAYIIFRQFHKILLVGEKETAVGVVSEVTEKNIFLSPSVKVPEGRVWVVPLCSIYLKNTIQLEEQYNVASFSLGFIQGTEYDNYLGL